jgi:hypothetical protein
MVPWGYVSELHLSGIREGADGTLHDGHSNPVYGKVWDLLCKSRGLVIEDGRDVIITIEHSDPCWITKKKEHTADFEYLQNILKSNRVKKSLVRAPEEYASEYLTKMLMRWIPKIDAACGERSLVLSDLVDDWLNENIQDNNRRIVFTDEEVAFNEDDQVIVAANSFAKYARERMWSCGAE